MGVHGLWRLIEPSGKPVPIETLENKILAVDISIWLHQAVKGFQDARGAQLPNAHLLGIYHRLCKLLYFRIKPVFVFDGGVPALKKQTIAKRNQQKAKNLNEATNIQQKLISTLLKHSAVQKAISDETNADPSTRNVILTKPKDDMFSLPNLVSGSELDSTLDSDYSDTETSDSSPTKQWDLHTIDEKSKAFTSLPADVRHDILTDLKEQRKQSSWGRLHELPKQSGDFSQFQMKRLLKRYSVQVSLEEAEKEMGGHTLSLNELEALLTEEGIVTVSKNDGRRIASNENKRYLLIKDVKKAIEEAKNDESLETIAEDENEETNDKKVNEYERDLQAAIQLSLEDTPSTSKELKTEIPSTSKELKTETPQDTQVKSKDGEYERDLEAAIQLSLQETASTSKGADNDYLKNLIEFDYDSDSDSDDCVEVKRTKNSLSAAERYMMEYADLTPYEIAKIVQKDKAPLNSKGKSSKFKSIVANGSNITENKVNLSDNSKLNSDKIVDLSQEIDLNLHKTILNEINSNKIIEIDCKTEDIKQVIDNREISDSVSQKDGTECEQKTETHIKLQSDDSCSSHFVSEPIESNPDTISTDRRLKIDESDSDSDFIDVEPNEKSNKNLNLDPVLVNGSQINIKPEVTSTTDKFGFQNDAKTNKKDAASNIDHLENNKNETVIVKNQETEIVELMSDSDDSDMVEVEDPTVKSNDKHFEVIINPSTTVDDDLFSDIFDMPPSKKITVIEEPKEAEHTIKETVIEKPNINDTVIKKAEVTVDNTETIVSTSVMPKKQNKVAPIKPNLTLDELNKLKSDLAEEQRELTAERNLKERLATDITDQMYQEAQELLELFGVPYLVAPMEAESQCAFLNLIDLTNGTITDDSDIWLFGGQTVYKNFFNQKKHVLEFRAEKIHQYFKLSREQMILLALLVGSDYTLGIQGIGPVTALEILSTFPPAKNRDMLSQRELLSGLAEFKSWLSEGRIIPGPGRTTLRSKLQNISINEGFPNMQVVQAYLQPEVETCRDKFSWGKPDFVGLIDYAKEKFGWTRLKSEEILKPVMKKLEENNIQKSIRDYFATKHKLDLGVELAEMKMSKRVKTAIHKMGKTKEELKKELEEEGKQKKRRPRSNKRNESSNETDDVSSTTENQTETDLVEVGSNIKVKSTRKRGLTKAESCNNIKPTTKKGLVEAEPNINNQSTTKTDLVVPESSSSIKPTNSGRFMEPTEVDLVEATTSTNVNSTRRGRPKKQMNKDDLNPGKSERIPRGGRKMDSHDATSKPKLQRKSTIELHKKDDKIPQKEQDKVYALKSKLRAIEIFRKSKLSPRSQKRGKKIWLPKEDAELSENSDSS